MSLVLKSVCKVNLLLNILGKRPDGFHALETVMQPVPWHDQLTLSRTGASFQLTCSDPLLPVNSKNLVHRAAVLFQEKIASQDGLRLHLEKNIPMAAGLGGGSGNAATTLLGLNELYGFPLTPVELSELAAQLGSDIPFFLQNGPALATGRGEKIQPLEFFPALQSTYIFLVHPGFGISTAWAYQQLAQFPEALSGRAGRAEQLLETLQQPNFLAIDREMYNSLEAPALPKYPLLGIFQQFLCEQGAWTSLMSGSGSTTFALVEGAVAVENLHQSFVKQFGEKFRTATFKLNPA